MLSAWCLGVAFLSPWVVGTPLLWLLHGCRSLRRIDWLWVPFVGLAGIICPLQCLVVFANLPLSQTAPWFWAALAVFWVVFVATRSGRRSLRTVSLRVVTLSLVAYLAVAAGLVAHGVEEYRGNVLSDQFISVVWATLLIDFPLLLESAGL